ncbi:MAG TPA: redoxin domain-containing protein [bacterium]
MQVLRDVLLVVIFVGMLTPGQAVLAAQKAPDFTGGGSWFNTGGQELHLAALSGKVVAVEMWTAGCYNCLNVVPWLKTWNETYRSQGFTVVGVHSPEFAHERSAQYVRDAVAKLGIRYPVVMDNDFKIWNAYRNVYWPTLYLIDKKGLIRYSHIGEGAYEETERVIQQLLAEHI